MGYMLWNLGGGDYRSVSHGHGLMCLCYRCRPRKADIEQPDTANETGKRTADEGITTDLESLERFEATDLG